MELSDPSESPKHSENDPNVRKLKGRKNVENGDLDPLASAANLTDGREMGDYLSRYPKTAWRQIIIEFGILLAYLLFVSSILLVIGKQVAAPNPADQGSILGIFEYPRDRTFLIWITIALSGMTGGTAFVLKWLYHSVAKSTWNMDRVIWRVIVPPLSGVLAVFVAFIVASGISSSQTSITFDSFYAALGSGFFIGYFSDNALAALQKLANRIFGTVDK